MRAGLHCPTFPATQNDDAAAGARIVALYAEKFGFALQPEDINCDGCLTVGGMQIGFCRGCEIKRCCSARGLANCALCADQPCDNLVKFQEFSPDAKACFEALLRMNKGC